MKILKEHEVIIPFIPVYLRSGSIKISITDFNEDQLRQIGKEWTEALIKKAKDERARLTLAKKQAT